MLSLSWKYRERTVIFLLKKSDHFSGSRIPGSPLKFRPIQWSVGSCIPFRKSDRYGGSWILHPPFQIWTDSAVCGFLTSPLEPWTYLAVRDSLHPSLKIRTDSAVRGSLSTIGRVIGRSRYRPSMDYFFKKLIKTKIIIFDKKSKSSRFH